MDKQQMSEIRTNYTDGGNLYFEKNFLKGEMSIIL